MACSAFAGSPFGFAPLTGLGADGAGKTTGSDRKGIKVLTSKYRQLAGCHAANGGCSNGAFHQCDLTEEITGPQGSNRFAASKDLEFATPDNIGGIGDVSLADDFIPSFKVKGLKTA